MNDPSQTDEQNDFNWFTFRKTAGCSRAEVQGQWCLVARTTGYNDKTMEMSEDVEAQIRNCMNTISSVLKEAEFLLSGVNRVQTTASQVVF